MERIVLSLLGAVVCANLYAEATGDIVIDIPKLLGENNTRPAVVLTPEEQEKFAFRIKLFNYPELNRIFGYELSTLSNFSKCKWVAIGTVVDKPTAFEERRPCLYSVVFSVDTCIHGEDLSKERLMFNVYVRGENQDDTDEIERRVPKPGDRMLVFLRRESENASPRLCSEFRAYIFLDDKETEEAVINAVQGYIASFGEGEKRNRDKYYEFLCSLLQSPVKRIRDDAELDLMLFFTKEKDPSPDLDKLLADERVRKELKDYLRYLLRNERPKEE